MIQDIKLYLLENNTGQIPGVKENPRDLTGDGFAKAKQSIKDFPEMLEVRTLVAVKHEDRFVVIGGNQHLRAMRDLDYDNAPVMVVDWPVDKINEFIIKDNVEYGVWNFDLLANEWDTELLVEWGMNLPVDFGDVDDITEGLTDENEVPEILPNPKSKIGDVWICGNHRLMCGDSTMIDDVAKLMAGKVVNFGFCDPPYNLGFEYNSYDDNKSDEEYRQFSKLWFSNLKLHSDRQAVTLGTKNIPIMANLDVVAGVGCWVKKNWITSCHIAKLQQWEPIFFYGDYTKFKRSSDLYEINRKIQKDVGDSHSCPKQIELIVDIVENYTNKNDSVMDLFGGSGTTMIAAEKTKRASYLMEFDPVYCDVIIKRWQDFTGKDAILELTQQKFNEL